MTTDLDIDAHSSAKICRRGWKQGAGGGSRWRRKDARELAFLPHWHSVHRARFLQNQEFFEVFISDSRFHPSRNTVQRRIHTARAVLNVETVIVELDVRSVVDLRASLPLRAHLFPRALHIAPSSDVPYVYECPCLMLYNAHCPWLSFQCCPELGPCCPAAASLVLARPAPRRPLPPAPACVAA